MRHGINLSKTLASSMADVSDPNSESVHLSDSSCSTKTFLGGGEFGSGEQAIDGAGQLSLRHVLPTSRFFAGNNIQFSSVADAAATASEGDLVVYRIGEMDPSKVVAQAMARGAAGILTEQVLPCPLPQCIVADIDSAMAHVTAATMDHPDRKLLTIGVLGSAGKTTTSLLISNLFRSCGLRSAYLTDLGESDGIVQTTSTDTVQSGAPLVEWISTAADSRCKAAIIEINDDDARHGHYDAIEFDLIVVTGPASCKGDFGPSSLQCILERLSNDGVVISSADDTQSMDTIRDSQARSVTYGVRKHADLSAKIIEQSGGMTTLMVTYQNTTALMETSLCGSAMAANHAAAILTGLLIAQPLEEILEKVSQLRVIPGRGQRLGEFGQATVVLDAGGSPERVSDCLRTQKSMKAGGRLWCVLAIDGDDSPETLAQYGNLMERFADNPVVTSTSSSKPKFLSGSHAILDGVEKCAAFRLVADRKRAIEWTISEARPEDTIVVITSERQNTAHQQRVDLNQITKWIENARAELTAERPTLKVVG